VPQDAYDEDATIAVVVGMLAAGENALAALRRLKAEGKMDDFYKLTEAADKLMQNGLMCKCPIDCVS
jgi:predicted RNA polymerase sigma factor